MEWAKTIIAKYITDADKVAELEKELDTELPKQFIPKGRFNEVSEELKIAKNEKDEIKKSFEELTKKASTVDEYEKKIGELNAKNKEIEENAKKSILSITKRSQLKELLMGNNAHKDALDLLVEKYVDIAEVDEKGIKGADKLIETIKAEKGGLFLETKVDSVDKNGNKKVTVDSIESDKIRKLMGLPPQR